MNDAPALAFVEFSSLAVGTRACDALAKKAPITLLRAGSLQPGKYAILFAGEVAAVEESFAEANRVGSHWVVDRVLLPDVHPAVHAAILGKVGRWLADTLGVIETPTMAAVIEAADAAVKGAAVEIVEIRLGDGLGGKGLAHFAGAQADVEAAIDIGSRRIAWRNGKISTCIIPRAEEALRTTLARSTRFGEGW